MTKSAAGLIMTGLASADDKKVLTALIRCHKGYKIEFTSRQDEFSREYLY
ncbi:hypothetical protein GCM10023310_43270 [Paenibacillus vulneris]